MIERLKGEETKNKKKKQKKKERKRTKEEENKRNKKKTRGGTKQLKQKRCVFSERLFVLASSPPESLASHRLGIDLEIDPPIVRVNPQVFWSSLPRVAAMEAGAPFGALTWMINGILLGSAGERGEGREEGLLPITDKIGDYTEI